MRTETMKFQFSDDLVVLSFSREYSYVAGGIG